MTAPDRLALAVRVRKARRASICTVCHAPVLVGQQIARLIRPSGWCHIACVPIVAALQATTAVVLGDLGEQPRRPRAVPSAAAPPTEETSS